MGQTTSTLNPTNNKWVKLHRLSIQPTTNESNYIDFDSFLPRIMLEDAEM